jgi:hypothetical protein
MRISPSFFQFLKSGNSVVVDFFGFYQTFVVFDNSISSATDRQSIESDVPLGVHRMVTLIHGKINLFVLVLVGLEVGRVWVMIRLVFVQGMLIRVLENRVVTALD